VWHTHRVIGRRIRDNPKLSGGTIFFLMPPPANLSITPPDPPPLSSDPSESDVEDPTTPKASQPPQLILIPDSPTSSMPPPSTIPSRVNTNATLSLSISTLPPQKRPRQKVVLAPGFSPLDWARLKSSGTDLRVPHPHFTLKN